MIPAELAEWRALALGPEMSVGIVTPACFADVNGQVYLRGQVTWSPAGATTFPVQLGALPSDSNGVCVCSPEMSKVAVTTTGLVYPRPFKPTMCTVRLKIEPASGTCGAVEIVAISCGSLQSVPSVPSYEVSIDTVVYFSDDGMQGMSQRKRERREKRAEEEQKLGELEADLALEEAKGLELERLVEEVQQQQQQQQQGRQETKGGGMDWREIAVSSMLLVCISALITVAARRG